MRTLKYHAGVVCAAIAAAVIGLTSCRPAGSSNNHSASPPSTQPKPSTLPPVLARHPQLQEGSVKFSVRLLQQILEERPNDNFCVSPLDVQLGLSLLLNGLQADGYQEVADALGYSELSLEEVNAFQRAVWEQIHTEGDPYEVRQAIALYTVAPYRWTAAVKQQAQDRYPAAFYELEEASLQQQIGQLQSWLQEQTKTRVALSPELWQQIAAYPTLAGIVSALFLKAEWEQPLGIAPPIEFRMADGRKRRVDAMAHRYKRLPYLEERDFEAVALPYRGGQLRFYLFLPREGVSLRQWVQQLDTARWRAWRKQFKEREVELHMPKFEVASEHDLRDALQQMGIQQVFRDFGLRGVIESAEKGGYIGLWTQQATLRVDARGTEAAAGTAITAFVQDYGTVQMRVDRPFLFAIVHEPTGLILFTGVLHAPPATARG